MAKVVGFFKKYPVVGLTLLIGALVLTLLWLGHGVPAQWIATGYVSVIIVMTSIDMARDIMRGHWGLDILAVVAMVATLAVGEYVAALIIVLMITGGEALEVYAASRARSELTSLLDRAPRTARRIRGDADDQEGHDQMEDVDVSDVEVGDVLLVRPAEVVPVDGELLDAAGVFDESSLTGESLPVERVRGDLLMSGSLNGQRAVRMRATATAADSQYQHILALVAEAEDAKAPTVRVADRFAVPFTVVSLLIAGVAWWVSGDPVRFAEVLVLATPCPLLIAAPVAFMGGMSRSARSGVIVKGGATLEALARAKSVALDKTGTLSHGRPELAEIHAADGFEADEVLHLAASAEKFSSHVLATGVIRAAEQRGLSLAPGVEASEIATNGVEATIGVHRVRVGKLSFVREVDPSAYFDRLEVGHTAVAVAIDGRFAGTLVLRDTLRENAAATVRVLREAGIGHIAMLTGDNEATAHALASAAGIDEVHAELLPEDKVRLVSELAPPVVMVGDGVNDAPVLAAADVGIAMGARGSTAASESADVVIMRDDIGRVAQALEIGRDTYRVALTAIWIGVLLSLGLMVVAAFGHIPAVAGALTQELVDLACILYALRALAGRTSHPELALSTSSHSRTPDAATQDASMAARG